MDIAISLVALIFLTPLWLGIAFAISVLDPGPILFRHMRIGRGGREFACFKFRSMAVDSEARLESYLASNSAARREWERHFKLALDPRITPIGRFLRQSSLDELPQLLNVLRGDMSLVGPRPIVSAEVRRYGRYFPAYCSIRPGLTGLWQVLGRNRLAYRRRVAADVYYVRRKSLWLNARILIATIPAVLLRRGAV